MKVPPKCKKMYLFFLYFRYVVLLKEVLRSFNSKYSSKSRAWILKNENDAYTLHLFFSFAVSVPQLILQLYLMAIEQNVPFWTGKLYLLLIYLYQ